MGDPRPTFAAGPQGTVYPVNVGSLEWALRYGSADLVLSDRMVTAAVVACYAHLVDPSRSQSEAIAVLKRARSAQRDANRTDQ